jgi:rhodanese-related sulfurtransferase
MDKTVVLYCDTGLLSAKAHLALRLADYENVKALLGGYLMWSQEQGSKEAHTKRV